MQPYSVDGEGDDRILSVQATASHRYKFWQIIDGNREEIHFKKIGSKIMGVVSSQVIVFEKPNAQQYHREYMQHNARAMWCGMQAQPERLLENMLEYVEII